MLRGCDLTTLPVDTAIDSVTAINGTRSIGNNAPDTSYSRVKCLEQLSVELDFDDLSAGVVDMRTNN